LTRIEPEIKTLHETRVVGKKSHMSFGKNTTARLWREFMPLRKDIVETLDETLWSVEVYPDLDYFRNFDPYREFEKWAAVAVRSFDVIPAGLEALLIPTGLYAVFRYRGKESEVSSMYRYIYGTWIHGSRFFIDSRPHFAKMGPGYKGEHPESEEELWIPVKEALSP
jgi:AraC family transcriptional regulator